MGYKIICLNEKGLVSSIIRGDEYQIEENGRNGIVYEYLITMYKHSYKRIDDTLFIPNTELVASSYCSKYTIEEV